MYFNAPIGFRRLILTMELTEQIRNIITPFLEGNRYFIVDVKASVSKLRSKITILLDADEGIGIDDLGKLSRAIETELEEIMESAYTLEVSSPGIDTPLSFERMYTKNIGRMLTIKMHDDTAQKAKLLEVSPDGITVLKEKLKKQKEQPIPHKIAFEDIKEAKVVVSFK